MDGGGFGVMSTKLPNCASRGVNACLPGDKYTYPDEGQNTPGVDKYGKQICIETRPKSYWQRRTINFLKSLVQRKKYKGFIILWGP